MMADGFRSRPTTYIKSQQYYSDSIRTSEISAFDSTIHHLSQCLGHAGVL